MKNSTLKFANGDKYEGELKGKKKHGYGVFTWADGSTFRGDWKDDKKHGHATFVDAKGEELKRLREEDNKVKFTSVEPFRKDPNRGMRFLKKCSDPINVGKLGSSRSFIKKRDREYY